MEELAAAGSSAVAVREVVGRIRWRTLIWEVGRRLATQQCRRGDVSVVVPADLALGRVPGREAQDGQVSALVAQVSQVLERAARDAGSRCGWSWKTGCSAGVQVDRVSKPGGAGAPQVLLLPIVTVPSSRVARVQPPALRHRIVIILSLGGQARRRCCCFQS